MSINFTSRRQSYEQDQLAQHCLPPSPMPLLNQWIQQADDEKIGEAYAFYLATCGQDLKPSVRTVLMREITPLANDGLGLVFYSNYDSAKGKDLAENPQAEALFYWASLERQVRIFGNIHKLDRQRSQHYFQSRPRDSQLAAWVSQPQSGMVANRDIMEQNFAKYQQHFAHHEKITIPDFWGGYQLIAEHIEFWQGRANRMHDRIVYSFHHDHWRTHRLLP